MNQLKALQRIMDEFESDTTRIAFLHDWLEDINYHTESAKVWGWLSEGQQNLITTMQQLSIAANRLMYTRTHYQALKDDSLVTDQHERVVDLLRYERIVPFNGYAFGMSSLREMQKVRECVHAMAVVFGSGVDNKLYKSEEQFLKTLSKLVGGAR